MKRFFSALTAIIFSASLFQGVALAAESQGAVHQLLSIENWLNENENSGSNYINETLKEAVALSKTWDKGAYLQEFEFTYKEGDHLTCRFVFASDAFTDKLAEVVCPQENADLTINEIPGTPTPPRVYGTHILMRYLVPLIRRNARLAIFIENGLLGDPATANVSVTIKLKVEDGVTFWEITFTDSVSGKTLQARTLSDAMRTRFRFTSM